MSESKNLDKMISKFKEVNGRSPNLDELSYLLSADYQLSKEMSDNDISQIRDMLSSSGDFSDQDLKQITQELKYQQRQEKCSKPVREKSTLDRVWGVVLPLLALFLIWYFVIKKV